MSETLFRPPLGAMRVLLYLASLLVILAGGFLTVFADSTETHFAWTIDPPLTAAFLGANYLGTSVIEFMAARQQAWANARIAVPVVLFFTVLTGIATVVGHRYLHYGTVYYWIWMTVYVAVPVVMAALLILQLRVEGADPPAGRPLSAPLRSGLLTQGAILTLLGLGLIFAPSFTEGLWPWPLTPESAVVDWHGGTVPPPSNCIYVGVWLLSIGFACFHAARENDALRIRPWMASFVAIAVLQLGVLARFSSDVNWGALSTLGYAAFLASMPTVGIGVLRAS